MKSQLTPTQAMPTHKRRIPQLVAALSLGVLFSTSATAQGEHEHHTMAAGSTDHSMHSTPVAAGHDSHSDHHSHNNHGMMEDHSAHMKMMNAQQGYQRSINHYALPDTTLVGEDGNPVQLHTLLADERPVILNFIFTSCTTVCPILSATLAQANKSFGDDELKPLMISISIDPQYDTPERLRDYAARYNSGENWHFLTGDLDSVIKLQRAFSAYYGNKLNHQPVSFLRQGPGDPWLRLQGFTTSAELVAEYRALLDSRS